MMKLFTELDNPVLNKLPGRV